MKRLIDYAKRRLLPESLQKRIKHALYILTVGPRAFFVDRNNRAKYGRNCPQQYQLIYCDPADIVFLSNSAKEKDLPLDAFIAGGNWDMDAVPLRPLSKAECDAADLPEFDRLAAIHLAREKLASGKSWQDVGEFDRMLQGIGAAGAKDGCWTQNDILERYNALDAVLARLRKGVPFFSQKELYGLSFRELGGLRVALNRKGEFIFLVSDGHHRLAAAQQYALKKMPVCLMLVHEECVTSGRFAKIMQRSRQLAAKEP